MSELEVGSIDDAMDLVRTEAETAALTVLPGELPQAAVTRVLPPR